AAELHADGLCEDRLLDQANAQAALAAQDGSAGRTAQNSCAAWAAERATRFARARPCDVEECVMNAAWGPTTDFSSRVHARLGPARPPRGLKSATARLHRYELATMAALLRCVFG